MKQTRILQLALMANDLLWKQALDDFLKNPSAENLEREKSLYREAIEMAKLLGAYTEEGGVK